MTTGDAHQAMEAWQEGAENIIATAEAEADAEGIERGDVALANSDPLRATALDLQVESPIPPSHHRKKSSRSRAERVAQAERDALDEEMQEAGPLRGPLERRRVRIHVYPWTAPRLMTSFLPSPLPPPLSLSPCTSPAAVEARRGFAGSKDRNRQRAIQIENEAAERVSSPMELVNPSEIRLDDEYYATKARTRWRKLRMAVLAGAARRLSQGGADGEAVIAPELMRSFEEAERRRSEKVEQGSGDLSNPGLSASRERVLTKQRELENLGLAVSNDKADLARGSRGSLVGMSEHQARDLAGIRRPDDDGDVATPTLTSPPKKTKEVEKVRAGSR